MNHHPFDAAQNSELFSGLEAHVLESVKLAAGVRRVPKDALLLKQGDLPEHLFVVAEGRFKMTTVNKQGVQKTLRFMQPGDAIGCAAVFREFPYPATASAATDSIALGWNAQQFVQLMNRYPQLATNALAMVGGRAEEMLQRIHSGSAVTVEQRIAGAIVRLMKQDNSGSASIPVSGQEIAELSDTTPFTVSRAISEWKRAGIVDGGRGRLVVNDAKRLSEIAEGG